MLPANNLHHGSSARPGAPGPLRHFQSQDLGHGVKVWASVVHDVVLAMAR